MGMYNVTGALLHTEEGGIPVSITVDVIE